MALGFIQFSVVQILDLKQADVAGSCLLNTVDLLFLLWSSNFISCINSLNLSIFITELLLFKFLL